ncbi:hypothetical protein [Companilactobacillus insicii]|uniref:hypothetical protein n=1 Tax=Companilactobacillus insicii TaxID=1732567 RepID=UPI000F7A4ABC|nr:hypothetical protein [Companilactobacillus insicii]
MKEQRQKLLSMVDKAYKEVQDSKYDDFRKNLLQFSKDLNGNEDYIKVMLGLRTELLQADLSLNLKSRISGLPTEYSDIYDFIDPQLREVDSKILDRYKNYGFIPLKNGSTVKY